MLSRLVSPRVYPTILTSYLYPSTRQQASLAHNIQIHDTALYHTLDYEAPFSTIPIPLHRPNSQLPPHLQNVQYLPLLTHLHIPRRSRAPNPQLEPSPDTSNLRRRRDWILRLPTTQLVHSHGHCERTSRSPPAHRRHRRPRLRPHRRPHPRLDMGPEQRAGL